MTIPDVTGSYKIGYIQSSRSLKVQLQGKRPSASVKLFLPGQDDIIGLAKLDSFNVSTRFSNLGPGEYSLAIQSGGDEFEIRGVGVGQVICAIGDSLTEGYHGKAFWRDDLGLDCHDFPVDSVSADRRNFPQYAPTAEIHWPEYNCFESWMTALNNLLAERLKQPIFIANEGWGGITSGQYLKKMREDQNWQNRIALLKPNLWLIHLGVNDERAEVPADTFKANMHGIVTILQQKYRAESRQIYLARPSYDYYDGADKYLQAYCSVIAELIEGMNLSNGPNFYRAFSTQKELWYGEDPVHPNPFGVNYMAELWAGSILNAASGQN